MVWVRSGERDHFAAAMATLSARTLASRRRQLAVERRLVTAIAKAVNRVTLARPRTRNRMWARAENAGFFKMPLMPSTRGRRRMKEF